MVKLEYATFSIKADKHAIGYKKSYDHILKTKESIGNKS